MTGLGLWVYYGLMTRLPYEFPFVLLLNVVRNVMQNCVMQCSFIICKLLDISNSNKIISNLNLNNVNEHPHNNFPTRTWVLWNSILTGNIHLIHSKCAKFNFIVSIGLASSLEPLGDNTSAHTVLTTKLHFETLPHFSHSHAAVTMENPESFPFSSPNRTQTEDLL